MFKTIDRYPDYEINEDGDVRNKHSKVLRKTSISNGHKRIVISHDGRTEYISRLVAETYISNPDNKPVVRHLDGDIQNNNVKNLEWSDRWKTQKDSYGWLGSNAPGGAEPAKKIMIVETGDIFPSIRSCARAIGGSPIGIRRCLNKETETHKGYSFKLLP